MTEAKSTSRRSFLDMVLGAGFTSLAAAVLFPVLRYLIPPARGGPATRMLVVNPDDPNQVDPETKVFVFGNKPAIIIRGPGGGYKAFSAICTHLSCTVRFKADTNQIWCPCHNGYFDLNGVNLPGSPPPRPLEEYRVQEREDGTVVVRKGRSA